MDHIFTLNNNIINDNINDNKINFNFLLDKESSQKKFFKFSYTNILDNIYIAYKNNQINFEEKLLLKNYLYKNTSEFLSTFHQDKSDTNKDSINWHKIILSLNPKKNEEFNINNKRLKIFEDFNKRLKRKIHSNKEFKTKMNFIFLKTTHSSKIIAKQSSTRINNSFNRDLFIYESLDFTKDSYYIGEENMFSGLENILNDTPSFCSDK